MRLVQRNLKTFYYKALASSTEDITDSVYTGDYTYTYGSVQTAKGNIGTPSGLLSREKYGIADNYDLKIIMESNPGITESSLLWIYRATTYNPDYRVTRVYTHFGMTVILCESIHD